MLHYLVFVHQIRYRYCYCNFLYSSSWYPWLTKPSTLLLALFMMNCCRWNLFAWWRVICRRARNPVTNSEIINNIITLPAEISKKQACKALSSAFCFEELKALKGIKHHPIKSNKLKSLKVTQLRDEMDDGCDVVWWFCDVMLCCDVVLCCDGAWDVVVRWNEWF